MQFPKLQIKKRVVYKHKNPTLSNAKNKYNEIIETTIPTILSTGIVVW
jgi:hypothetical protein